MLLKFMLTPRGLLLDRWLVRWTGYSLLNYIFGKNAGFPPQPALLLVTRGRRSGKSRSVALPYFVIEGKMLLVGSKGGAPTDPYWVQNLRSDPHARIYVKRKPRDVVTRIASGVERAQLWHHLTALIPSYAEYEKLTEREIPVVVLEKQ